MTVVKKEPNKSPFRRRSLLLAAMALTLAGIILSALWTLPALLSRFTGAEMAPSPSPTATSALPSATLAPTPPPASPLPAHTPSPTPSITRPAVQIWADVDDRAATITFHVSVSVPPDRQIVEATLWYDTEVGRQLHRFPGPFPPIASLAYELDAVQEGLTTTLAAASNFVIPSPAGQAGVELDYWWSLQDSAGESTRAGATVTLSPAWHAWVSAPTAGSWVAGFDWGLSESQHFVFHYVPGSAAERDMPQLQALAEAALDRIVERLDVEFDAQMSVYLVPRVFWQGGATYGDKVKLISYLDRNYAAVETWTYFTHEGTHALAQDLLQPKEGGGGPDGVLVEGLAVWATGGHYRQEPLDAWAAVVAASDGYIPLADLRSGPFYDFQHEISYLEAGSFVGFLVEGFGLDRLKELYGQATGQATLDESLVQRLYGQSYAELESAWLAYLSSLAPTEEQARAWHLKVRAFELMRRYETELDPDARILPDRPPPAWTTETLQIFLKRAQAPVNLSLETALIAAQERLQGQDLEGAAALLDDIEAALEAGGRGVTASLQERQAILRLLAAQDRAILRGDTHAYVDTLTPNSSLARDDAVRDRLQPPFTTYRQEIVRLDLSDDNRSAQGVVLLHARVADGSFPEDMQLFALIILRTEDGWFVSGRSPLEPSLSLPPPVEDL
jgi:hypothetical protein